MDARSLPEVECEDCGAVYQGSIYIHRRNRAEGDADRCPFCGGETELFGDEVDA